jgi:hypothetical protein
MTDRIDITDRNGDDELELLQLRRLFAEAPSSVFIRFRRRTGLLQGARMLAETQVYGFWLVLDIILKRLFLHLVRRTPAGVAAADSSHGHVGDRV